jgi:hypothetical protein
MGVLTHVLGVFIYWFTVVVAAVIWYAYETLFISFLLIDYAVRRFEKTFGLYDTTTEDEAFAIAKAIFIDGTTENLLDRQLDFFIGFDLLLACWIFEFKPVRQFLLATCFLVPFSSLAEVTLSNEYLLFCCLVYAVFMLYGVLMDLVASSFSAPIANLRATVSKKQLLLLEVLSYRASLQVQYQQAADSLTELISELSVADAEYMEVAEVVFEQALVESTQDSLFYSLADELADVTLEESAEFNEEDQDSLDELVASYLEEAEGE